MVFTPVTVSRIPSYHNTCNSSLTTHTDKPNETLESDARMISGRNPPIEKGAMAPHNPQVGKESPANK